MNLRRGGEASGAEVPGRLRHRRKPRSVFQSMPPVAAQILEGRFTLAAAVNDPAILRNNLLASPSLPSEAQIAIEEGHPTGGAAYNAALDDAEHEIVIIAHQDIYLPRGWFRVLADSLAKLERTDPNWGVLGVYGVGMDRGHLGHVYSTGRKVGLGQPFTGVAEVLSLDEIILIMRKSSGLRFDAELPGFHLFGTDICTTARKAGMKSYVVPAYCLHNSRGIGLLPSDFWTSYRYLRRKWRADLPLYATCAVIKPGVGPWFRSTASGIRRRFFEDGGPGRRVDDPEALYRKLIDEGSLAPLPIDEPTSEAAEG